MKKQEGTVKLNRGGGEFQVPGTAYRLDCIIYKVHSDVVQLSVGPVDIQWQTSVLWCSGKCTLVQWQGAFMCIVHTVFRSVCVFQWLLCDPSEIVILRVIDPLCCCFSGTFQIHPIHEWNWSGIVRWTTAFPIEWQVVGAAADRYSKPGWLCSCPFSSDV